MDNEQICIAAKLQNKSEAYIKKKLSEENRKKYLDNFIEKINKEIDNLVEQGENFLELNIGIYKDQRNYMGADSFIIPQNCLNLLEIEDLKDSFNKRGYTFLYSNIDTCDYTKGKIMIYFGQAK